MAFKCRDPPLTVKHLEGMRGPGGACTLTSPAAGVALTSVLHLSHCTSKEQALETPGNVWKHPEVTKRTEYRGVLAH